MKKLEEIKWRLENRTVAYLLPGCPPNTVAHDDMEFLVRLIEALLNEEKLEREAITSMTNNIRREIERRHNLLDGILSM